LLCALSFEVSEVDSQVQLSFFHHERRKEGI